MQLGSRQACPHCGSDRTGNHGAFVRVDGTREPRWRCGSCGRTFCAQTGTPTAYLKKRQQWEQMPQEMAQHKTVRRLALVLGVRPATIFRWRHRLLAEICQQPQPRLTGEVALANAWVRYSEKGNRKSGGPGAWASRIRPRLGKPFRRFVDGKSSCVLVACGSGQLCTAITGQGRPSPVALQVALGSVLVPECTVWTEGFDVPAADCRELGYFVPDVPRSSALLWSLRRDASAQRSNLYGWLHQFRGVATRYLSHYLAWFRQESQVPEVTLVA